MLCTMILIVSITTQRYRRLCQHRNQIYRVEAVVVFLLLRLLFFYYYFCFLLHGFPLSTSVCPHTLRHIPVVCACVHKHLRTVWTNKCWFLLNASKNLTTLQQEQRVEWVDRPLPCVWPSVRALLLAYLVFSGQLTSLG